MNDTYFASEIRYKNDKKQYMKKKKYNKQQEDEHEWLTHMFKALLCESVFFEVACQGLGASTTASPSQLPLATGAAVG